MVTKFKFELKRNLPFLLGRLQKDYLNFIELAKVHKNLAHEIDKKGFDVVLCHTDVFTEAPFILRYLKTPSVYYCEELLRIGYEKELLFKEGNFVNRFYENITRGIRKHIDRVNVQSADLILTTSKFMQSNIKKAYRRSSIVCCPGVDSQIFHPVSIKKENKILFMGNKNIIDGYFDVEKAINLINEKIRPKLELLTFSKKGPKIKNDDRLVREYSSSLATVCADRKEPFGLKVLESLACGTPVVAVDDGGYRETVNNSKYGFLVERNPKEIAKKIIYLIRRPKKARLMGMSGRKDVIKNWNWQKHGEIVESNLAGLVRSKDVGLKVLISGQDSGGWGGAEKLSCDLADKFESKGVEVLFTVVRDSVFDIALRKKGKRILTVFPRMDILGRWKGLIKFIFFLPFSAVQNFMLLRKFKVWGGQLIVISGFSDKLILSSLAKFFRLKIIWIEHASMQSVMERNWHLPKILYSLNKNLPDKVISVSANTTKELVRAGIFPRCRIETIPNGIEIADEKSLRRFKLTKKDLIRELGVEKK